MSASVDKIDLAVGRVLQRLVLTRPVSRRDLARDTGLSASTVSKAVSLLLQRGYIVEKDAATGVGAGRPAVPLDLDEDRIFVLAVQLSTTSACGGLVNLRGAVTETRSVPLMQSMLPQEVVAELGLLVGSLLDDLKAQGGLPKTVLGVSVGAGGHIHRGVVVYSPSYGQHPDWRDVDLASQLQALTDLPVIVENDANALATREYWFGDVELRGVDSLAVVVLGEGIGSGRFERAALARGHSGAAGELGHLVLYPEGPWCACGKQGCLEAVTSMQALRRHVGGGDPAWAEKDLDEVFELADREGGDDALMIIKRAGTAAGRAVAMLLNLSNPRRLTVYLPPALVDRKEGTAEVFKAEIRAESKRNAFSTVWDECSFGFERLTDEIMISAAGSTVLDRFFRNPLYRLTSDASSTPSRDDAPLQPQVRGSFPEQPFDVFEDDVEEIAFEDLPADEQARLAAEFAAPRPAVIDLTAPAALRCPPK